MRNAQLAKPNALLKMRLKYYCIEEEWKAEKKHLMAQLKVCQRTLKAYITPYKWQLHNKGS